MFKPPPRLKFSSHGGWMEEMRMLLEFDEMGL